MGQTEEATLLYLIKQVELAVRSRLDEATGPFGLTSLQYTALTVLERHPGTTASALARNSFVRAQTMAQMVTYLEEGGFVQRERDPRSKRQYLLSLAPRGARALAALREPVRTIEREMVAELDPSAVDQLAVALRACRAGLGGGAPR